MVNGPGYNIDLGKKRCAWCKSHPLYIQYHDNEWGVPVHDDLKLFEFLVLENFQAGLNWLTILKKRQDFSKYIDNFDYNKIANYNHDKLNSLLKNSKLIRNKLKINALKNNAICFIKIQKKYGSFNNYIWGFMGNKPINNKYYSIDKIPSKSTLSEKISCDLKKEGFKYVGATIIYAYMQAIGMINDHIKDCFRYKEIQLLT